MVTGAVIAVRPGDVVRITVLDVGQGDAILVEGADGGRLLVDGGPDPDRLLVVLDRHIPPWDRRIDAVILTHPHEDHVAGLALLLDRYRVARVFEPGMRGPGPGYAAWLDRLGRPGAPVRLGLATGDRLAVDAIRMRVLWPDRGTVPAEPPDTGSGINNVSIVLLGEVGGRRFLLTGDMEQDIDPVVLARGIPRVDLLKVAHHGSRTATTEAFVAAADPSVAIASAGADNPYGHPTRVHAGPAPGERRPGVPDGPGWLGHRGVHAGRVDGPDAATPGRRADRRPRGRRARPGPPQDVPSRHATGSILRVRRPGGGRPVREPRRRSRSRTRALPRSLPPHRPHRPTPRTGSSIGSATIGSMTVPSRSAAAALLLSLDPPPWALAHARAVAEVAAWLARRIEAQGMPVDRRAVEAAALLHDVDKLLPPDDPARALPHGDGSAAWLTRHGHPELARPVAGHPVTRLVDGEAHRRWAAFASREERIVAYADKRAGQHLESMAARFASWAPTLPGDLGRTRPGARSTRARRAWRPTSVAPRASRPAIGRSAALDRCAPSGPHAPRAAGTAGRMIAPLLYIWGDDDLIAGRLVERFERGARRRSSAVRWSAGTCAAISRRRRPGRPSSRSDWRPACCSVAARWPSCRNPGALVRRNDTRDRVVAAISMMAAGNAVVFVEAARSSAKGPGPKRLADAVTAAGGRIVSAMAPRPTALGAWVESEARDRDLALAPGAARELADRLGARVTDGDVDRRFLSRVASGELDKLALRHALDGGPVTVEDVRGLVAESTPGSVWALTDAVGDRRGPAALVALDRLIETTPEPVLLAVLHRRVVELLELGDRMSDGTALPAAARAMGITSEFRAKTLAGQARRWTTDELTSALAALVDLDAMVKGVTGSEADAAQRRLAFTIVGPRARDGGLQRCGVSLRLRWRPWRRRPARRPGGVRSVGGRPGLFLDDEVALDGEDAAAFAEIEQLDQVRIDVQLRAVLAESTRDAEAQALAPVGQPERRIEAGRDEPVATGWTPIPGSGHGAMLGRTTFDPA